jgi:mannitol/fructose-specific phosphotransferase system IIA component
MGECIVMSHSVDGAGRSLIRATVVQGLQGSDGIRFLKKSSRLVVCISHALKRKWSNEEADLDEELEKKKRKRPKKMKNWKKERDSENVEGYEFNKI